jgi:hypothetical protein
MTQEFIPYEQALELKELGFKYGCQRFYNKNKKIKWSFANGLGQEYFNQSDAVAAPLYQQAFRWFREKYDLFSYIDILERQNGEVIYDYVIVNNDLEESEDDRKWNTFEEAELECLKQLIEITKNK